MPHILLAEDSRRTGKRIHSKWAAIKKLVSRNQNVCQTGRSTLSTAVSLVKDHCKPHAARTIGNGI